MASADIRARASEIWQRNFWAALAVLFALKVASIGMNVLAPETRGAHPFYKYVLKSFIVFGADILGAALLALIAAIACLPSEALGHRRLSLSISVAIQAAHAFLGAVSFFALVFIGGPLNKAALDLAMMSEPDEGVIFGEALRESIAEYVTFGNVAVIVAAIALSVAVLLLAPRLFRRLTAFKGRAAAVILTLEVVATMIVLPFLASGEIGGIRVYTYDLEKSPAIELAWSYARAGRNVDMRLIEDEFRFDWGGAQGNEGAVAAPLAGAAARRTNVLVVAMESIGASYLEGEDTPMPFLRALSRSPRAHSFRAHYSTWSLTSKAFFSVFCSELPYPTYKAESLINPAIPCVSLSEALHDDGYFTAFLTGQDLAYDRQTRFFQHRALDVARDLRSMPGVEERWKGDWGLDDRLVIRNLFDVISAAREERPDRPFFVFYGMTAGHHPFLACKEHERNPLDDRVANYMRALGFVDERLREIFEGLEARGLAEDTLVVIFSDHGDGHGRYVGRNAWDPVIRVPMLLVGPQLEGAAGECGLVTSHLDIAPTILGLLGRPVPCTMKGRDLTADGTPRIALFGGRPPKWQLGLADGRFKFIWEDHSLEMLFDLAEDPAEERNIAQANRERVELYKRKVDEWSAFSTNLIENYGDIAKRARCASR